jgi:Cu(I)/Ag(I) efflux system membrane protein CusA/SilA
MTAKIIELALKNRLLVVLLTVMLVGAGIWRMFALRLDAIPDLSDVQVIVTTEVPGQNPQVVDDQVTYPLASAMLSVPGSTVVRGISMFEQSFVYVLFEDGTDIYWARSRVLESLNFARDRMPSGIEPKLGPDATGVGWVYQYVLLPGWYCPSYPKGLWHDAARDEWFASIDETPQERREELRRVRGFEAPGTCPLGDERLVEANLDLAELRSLQDWTLRYPLTAVEGVSEVASIGGFVKQYQVILEPNALFALGLPLGDVIDAIAASNNDVGGSVVELSENEYMVRSRGYLRGLEDLAQVPVGLGEGGTPVLLGDVATLAIAGEARRGIGEYNGMG